MNAFYELFCRVMSRQRALVVMFHNLQHGPHDPKDGRSGEAAFEQVLDFVGGHFETVPLSEIVDRMARGRSVGGLAALTFDDGYPDWLPQVAPILKRRRLPASFFVTTSQLDGHPLWSERIAYLLRHGQPAAPGSWRPSLPEVNWTDASSRERAIEPMTQALKYIPTPERDEFIRQMEQSCGIQTGQAPRFTMSDLQGLAREGFEIGSHTIDHPILTCCDEDQAWREIAHSRERLSDAIGQDVRFFAYPNGKPRLDFSQRDVELVRRAGYQGAVTTDSGAIDRHCPALLIPRFSLWPSQRASLGRQTAGQLRRSAARTVSGEP
jgi:peptidoglycan/xylan/chitin deacetylase (PgdA/CDA1 family)